MFVEIGGIEPMTELSKIDQNDHIKYESSRVLALVTANSRIFLSFSSSFISSSSKFFVNDLTCCHSLAIYGSLVLKQEGGGQAIVKLLTSKFPILHMEAINALKTLIQAESNRPLVAKEPNLIYALLTLIDSSLDVLLPFTFSFFLSLAHYKRIAHFTEFNFFRQIIDYLGQYQNPCA
jgi:hypothetical protein